MATVSRRQPPLLAVVKKRLPDPPTLPAIRNLINSASSNGQLRAAFIVPNVLIGLLDCVVDDPDSVDAEMHMDALGVRAAWRLTRSSTPDGAPRVISARLKGTSVRSALIVPTCSRMLKYGP